MSVRAFFLLAAIGTGACVSGCASPAKPDAMVPTIVPATHRNDHDVMVAVSGGKATSSAGASQISDEDFATALRQSLEKSGVFAKVSPAGAYYKLTAYIGNVDQPILGASMTVSMEVSYALINTASGESVWTKNVLSKYTAAFSEAFAGPTRLRLANEGAARDSIQQAIGALETAQF